MGWEGFDDAQLDTKALHGIYLARVVNVERNPDDPETSDMEMLGRVQFELPGICEPSAWAFPIGGGAPQWGIDAVPPIGADVYIMFLNGDVDRPIWLPAYHGLPNDPETGESAPEAFPEFTHPKIAVLGLGPFRIVFDYRGGENPRQVTIKNVKEVAGEEDSTAEIVLDADNNSIRIHSDRLVKIESSAMIDIDGRKVQINGRTVMPTTRPIN